MAMTQGGQDIADESWTFALKLYAEPGISQACLKLQADAGVDVMLLLVAVFAATQKQILLTSADIEEMDDVCRRWREQIVYPLRTLRVALKSGPAPAPSAAAEKLRSQIKAAELAAERLENDLLADWLRQRVVVQRELTRDGVGRVIGDVVRHALGEERQVEFDSMLPVIATIVLVIDELMQ